MLAVGEIRVLGMIVLLLMICILILSCLTSKQVWGTMWEQEYKEAYTDESSIPVLKQQSYTGGVLPSTVANIPCTALGVDGMLEKLNPPVHTLGSPLYMGCEYFVAENYDLGTAYAHLHHHLHDFNINIHITKAHKSNEKMQQDLLKKRKIRTNVSPWHVWDLHANQVVP